jgi:hypothetical protein
MHDSSAPRLTLRTNSVECATPSSIFAAWLRGESLGLKAKSTFPGGSKERVNRAGNAVREGNPTIDDLAVIDLWRAAHRPVLNTFQAILRMRTRTTSTIVAQRHKRKRTSCHPELSDKELVRKFLEIDSELGLMRMLRHLNLADSEISKKQNVILMFAGSSGLEMRSFNHATEAIKELFELEKMNPGKDIVLVRAGSTEDVRIAFKNYFSDARECIDLIDRGCQKLSQQEPVKKTARQTKRMK